MAKDISDAIISAKEHREWEVEYMTLDMKIKEELDIPSEVFCDRMIDAGFKIPSIVR